MKLRFQLSTTLLLSFILSSCKDQNPNEHLITSKEGETKLTQRVKQISTSANLPFKPIGLFDETLHKEPETNSWRVEQFNELTKEQFEKLKKTIASSNSIIDADLNFLTSNSFNSCLLTPKETVEIYNNKRLKIIKGIEPINNNQEVIGLNAMLHELISPLGRKTKLKTKFKTFNVSLNKNGQAESQVLVDISNQKEDQLISIKSEWTCYWEWSSENTNPRLKSINPRSYQLCSSKIINNQPLFSDCTKSVFKNFKDFERQFNKGINYWASRIENRYGIGLAGWHGMAIGDANGDGIDDIYICEPGGLPNKLFISKRNGQIIDASSLSGTDFRIQSQSALFIDYDNDNDQDLIIATTIGIIFMENDGKGNYSKKRSELIPESAPMCLSASDYDNDGDLDIFVGCYSLRRSSIPGNESAILARPIPYHDANNGGRNLLLRNDRNWNFTNVTIEVGLDTNNRRFTLASSWADYDMDGDQDLYVANDYGRNNLYRNDTDNNGGVNFVDVAAETGVEDMSAGMSVSWADADLDGDLDLYVSNMWSSAGNRIAYQRQFMQKADKESLEGFRRHARGNSLFINSGNGKFKDSSLQSGASMGRWAWGSRFADINNDGLQDILVSNGFITQPEDTGDL